MKILVTTIFFPPQNLIASQRTYVWARTWARLEHDVTVLTIEKDEGEADKLNRSFDGFRVIQVAAGPVIRGLRGRRRGLIALPHGAPVADWKSRFTSWLRSRGLMSSVRWPDAFDFVLPNVWRELSGKAAPSRDRYEVIVSSFGPHASLAMGYFAKRMNPKAKWVLDFRDLWVGNHVYPGIWPFALLEPILERFYVTRADIIVTVSEALANELRARYPLKKVVVSPNGFDPEEVVVGLNHSADIVKGHVTIVYTGSLHEDQRSPEPLFEALIKLPREFRSKVRMKFAGAIPRFMPPLVERYALTESVELLGKCPREESLRLQAEADVLLFLEKQHDESRDGVMTGKLFEYLVTGRPIWAIGVDSTTTVGRLIEGGGAGVALGSDVDAIVAQLRLLVSEGRSPSRNTQDSNDVGRRYNRETLATELMEWISAL